MAAVVQPSAAGSGARTSVPASAPKARSGRCQGVPHEVTATLTTRTAASRTTLRFQPLTPVVAAALKPSRAPGPHSSGVVARPARGGRRVLSCRGSALQIAHHTSWGRVEARDEHYRQNLD